MPTNHGWIHRLLCWSVPLIFSANAAFAEAQPMLLTAHGDVRVNGVAVPHSVTVFTGDKIDTEKQSSVILVATGVQITLAPDSAIVYGNAGPSLSRGLMSVSTTAGASAELGNVRITPAKGKARYEMIKTPDRMTLAAVEGALTVSDGENQVVLPQGTQMSRSTDQQASETGPPQPVARAGVFGHIPGWAIAVGAAAVAGGIAAGVILTSEERRPVSPSVP